MKKKYLGTKKSEVSRTKSGKKLYIALCIFVKYIHGKQVIYLYRNIYAVKLKYIYFERTTQ